MFEERKLIVQTNYFTTFGFTAVVLGYFRADNFTGPYYCSPDLADWLQAVKFLRAYCVSIMLSENSVQMS